MGNISKNLAIISIILIVLGFLGVFINHLNKTIRETIEILQHVPHIMDTPPTVDLSDTMVFYTKDTFNTKEK